MEFWDVLRRRRMVRNYLPDPINDDVFNEVASAAFRAPSAGFSQGTVVVVVTDEGQRTAIAELADESEYVKAGFDPWISRSPAHIVIAVSEDVYHERYRESDKVDAAGEEIAWPIPYWWVDAGAAMMAVLLAAVDAGLAAGFLGVHSVPSLAERLELPGGFVPIGVITVGHPAPDRRSKSLSRGHKPLQRLLHHNRWQNY